MERRCETRTARRSGGRTSKIGLDREVDLGDVGHHLAVPALLQHALAEFLPSWSHVLTVTAPRRVKLHKPIPGRGPGHTLSQVFKIFRREDLRDPSTLRGGELLGHFSRLSPFCSPQACAAVHRRSIMENALVVLRHNTYLDGLSSLSNSNLLGSEAERRHAQQQAGKHQKNIPQHV
jgi:hypothetical protein